MSFQFNLFQLWFPELEPELETGSLVYHLACMYADLGRRVLAADLDPQANLTAAFLDEARLERIWRRSAMPAPTVRGMLAPLIEGTGDIAPVAGQTVGNNLFLLPGDLELSGFEDELSQAWPRCLEGAANPRAFRVMSALGRLLRSVAALHSAEIVVVDVGPNLGVINRAALVASEHVVVPLAPDLFSVQGLRNLGPALRSWRDGWAARRQVAPASVLDLPAGRMQPLGYVLLAPNSRQDRPTKAHQRWISRVPGVYAAEVLGRTGRAPADVAGDSRCLAQIPHYRSLMPMAQEARRPVFALRNADGAIGSHAQTVQKAYRDFSTLAIKIARRMAAADDPALPPREEPGPGPGRGRGRRRSRRRRGCRRRCPPRRLRRRPPRHTASRRGTSPRACSRCLRTRPRRSPPRPAASR